MGMDILDSIGPNASYCYTQRFGDRNTVMVVIGGEIIDSFPGWFPSAFIDKETGKAICLYLVSDPIDRYVLRREFVSSAITVGNLQPYGPPVGCCGGQWFINGLPGSGLLLSVDPDGRWAVVASELPGDRVARVYQDPVSGKPVAIVQIPSGLIVGDIVASRIVPKDMGPIGGAIDACPMDGNIVALIRDGQQWSIRTIGGGSDGGVTMSKDIGYITDEFGVPDWWMPISICGGKVFVGVGLHTFHIGTADDPEERWSMVHLSPLLTADDVHVAPTPYEGAVQRQDDAQVSYRGDVGVVLLCHPAYLPLVPKSMASIDLAGFPDGSKLLVCDGFDPEQSGLRLPIGWTYVTGEWGSPNPGRNLGASLMETEWVVFFDADNEMNQDYYTKVLSATREATDDVGIIYPHIKFVDSSGSVWRDQPSPPWDRWAMARRNFIDTSSAWRRYAVLGCGGWDEITPSEDDYGLATKLVHSGWTGQPFDGIIVHNDHWEDPGRWGTAFKSGLEDEALWRARTFCCLCLLSGRRELFRKWSRWFFRNDFPPTIKLILVDNSCDAKFAKMVNRFVSDLRATNKFRSIEIISKSLVKTFYEQRMSYFHEARHQHVANLYGELLSGIDEDMILTFEDDVFPPDGALWDIHHHFVESFCSDENLTAAVAAAYGDPIDPSRFVTASTGNEDWGPGVIEWEDLKGDPVRSVMFVGGGFTLWGNWAVRQHVPFGSVLSGEGRLMGWDYQLCQRIRHAGDRILLDGLVRCEHLPRRWAESSAGGKE